MACRLADRADALRTRLSPTGLGLARPRNLEMRPNYRLNGKGNDRRNACDSHATALRHRTPMAQTITPVKRKREQTTTHQAGETIPAANTIPARAHRPLRPDRSYSESGPDRYRDKKEGSDAVVAKFGDEEGRDRTSEGQCRRPPGQSILDKRPEQKQAGRGIEGGSEREGSQARLWQSRRRRGPTPRSLCQTADPTGDGSTGRIQWATRGVGWYPRGPACWCTWAIA